MDRVLGWFRGLSPREQRTVLIGLAACAALLVLALLLPFERRVAHSRQAVQSKQADLLWLKSVAPQLASLRRTAPAAGNESLVVLADRVARETGIARSLTGSQPIGNGDLSVQMEHVAFDALVNWAAELVQRHGVNIVSATIDGGGGPGAVSATFVLHAP